MGTTVDGHGDSLTRFVPALTFLAAVGVLIGGATWLAFEYGGDDPTAVAEAQAEAARAEEIRILNTR